MVSSDYYSNYIYVSCLRQQSSKSVIGELKTMFSRFGIPDTVISDNGTQFASEEFAMFAKKWNFKHEALSPRYPQSNGKAENAVQTVKRLFKKCKQTGQSEYLAILDWNNTATEGMTTSPSQRFMGRRCKTLLPMSATLLKPQYQTERDVEDMIKKKRKQMWYYNRSTRPLSPISPGESVRIRLPDQTTWTPGTCQEMVTPRSYKVKVGSAQPEAHTIYKRLCREGIRTREGG